MDGFPGVKTARFLGENATQEDRNNYLIKRLEGIPKAKRTVQFITCIAYIDSQGNEKIYKGILSGYIAEAPRGNNGFGFDEIFELEDGNKIESVLMFHDYGTSICVSSQVGCNMTCAFCESGRLKKVRNLLAYEIVQQILQIEEDINKRITHVVLMGIGEPFDNYDNVLRFVKIINCGKGIDIGSRHITISTCGVIPGIKKFMNEEGQVNLAISLHAPNNALRSRIMPINKAYPLNELMETIKEYINKTNRRVTFEYIMLDNVNDSEENAKELAILLKGINCYVNLIPYNETENIEFKRTKEWKIMKFYDILKKNKINVTIRKEFGGSVDAACGQLRANN